MASNLRRSKRTVGKRIGELNRRVSRLQKRPAPRRLRKGVVTTSSLAQNAVTGAEIAPGAVSSTELTSAVTSSISDAQDAADAAQATADGKNKIYRQTTQPTGGTYAEGDLWFDTDDGNKFYRYTSGSWTSFTLGDSALASISANKITAGTIDASVITVSNINAGNITSGTISSARITTSSISAASINADNITSGTITGITLQTLDADLSNGIKITSSGYIQGRGGSGVRIMNSDNSTGSTQLFKDVIFTGRFDGAEFLTSDGTSSHRMVPTFSEFKRFTDNTPATLNLYRAAWINTDYTSASASVYITFRRHDNFTVGTLRHATGDTPTTLTQSWTSDARLKIALDDTIDPLEIVNRLQPRCFRWLDHKEGRVSYGVYAQEAQEVLPDHVFVGDSAVSATFNEETGTHTVEDPWSVDYTGMIPYLIGAIKELSKKVDELESKIQ